MFGLFFMVLCSTVVVKCGTNQTGESRLFKDIVMTNNPYERPVYDKEKNITVSFDFVLRRVIKFQDTEQQLVCTGWFLFQWTDQFLTWNRSLYGGTEFIRPPASQVWRPPVVVSNSFQQLNYVGGGFTVLQVFSNGQVNWLPGDVFYLPCSTQLQRYPFDNLVCKMELLVWSYSTAEVTLRHLAFSVDITSFQQTGDWILTSTKIKSTPFLANNNTYSRYMIIFNLDRQPLNFVFSFLIPVIILSLIGSFVFLIPSDSGEKLSFAITILLSYGVYLSFLTNMVPQSSDGVSVFVIFLGVTLTASAFFVVLSIFSVRCCSQGETVPVPRLISQITLWIERVKNCGRIKPTNNEIETDENDQLGKDMLEIDRVTWKRVSEAIDLFCFCVVITSLVMAIILLMLKVTLF